MKRNVKWFIAVAQYHRGKRSALRLVGGWIKALGKKIIAKGEEPDSLWGAALYRRLPGAELCIKETDGGISCGPIINLEWLDLNNGSLRLVFKLNWLARKSGKNDAFVFSQAEDVWIDPVAHPAHYISDEGEGSDMVWFFLPSGAIGTINFNSREHLRYAGDPMMPRAYGYM